MMHRFLPLIIFVLVVGLVLGCSTDDDGDVRATATTTTSLQDESPSDPTISTERTNSIEQPEPSESGEPEQLSYTVLDTVDHNPDFFTQGLVYREGIFYESTGAPGGKDSHLYAYWKDQVLSPLAEERVEPMDFTRWITSGDEELSDSVFAEGLELVGDDLYQLTWKDEIAFVWGIGVGSGDLDDITASNLNFIPKGAFKYSGEGWGLCSDGEFLYMSDGTAEIQVRDPLTFEKVGTFAVTQNGFRINTQLNELECAKGYIWANQWFQDEILQIQPETGRVVGILDLAELEQPRPTNSGGVLNGIAYDEVSDSFWFTGKYWNQLYQLEIHETES